MMRLPKTDYHAAQSVEEACSVIAKYGDDARILAGGTDLLPACKFRNLKPALLVSLRNVSELKGIRLHEGQGLRIGAMTSLYQVRNDPLVKKLFPALAEAAATVGATQIQHMGTLGGNLCLNTRCIYYNQSESWRKSRDVCLKMGGEVCHVVPNGKRCYAVFSGDTVPAMIALDARVRLISNNQERVAPLSSLYTCDGKNPNSIGQTEILTEIVIPEAVSKQKSTYLKYRAREAIDFPLAGAAVRIDYNDGKCTNCKVVLNAVDSAPVEVQEPVELLNGNAPIDQLITQLGEKAEKSAHPVANTAGSQPAHRRKMAGILTRRALQHVFETSGLKQGG